MAARRASAAAFLAHIGNERLLAVVHELHAMAVTCLMRVCHDNFAVSSHFMHSCVATLVEICSGWPSTAPGASGRPSPAPYPYADCCLVHLYGV